MRALSRVMVNADTLADAAGALTLFAILWALFWIGHGLGLPTGGAELLEVAR